MDSQTANELLAAIAKRGDREAFAELFRHYAPQLKRYLMRGGVDARAAEELTQEVMILVWRKARLFDPAQANASTWIFTIARNKRIDRLRRERRPEIDPDDPLLEGARPPGTERLAIASQRATALRDALGELPEVQASILSRAYFGGMSLREIAEEDGVSLGTVKSRVRLAMARLRARLRLL